MSAENEFELNAMIELFGHQRIAGLVTEHNIGGASFVRVDVPETDKQPKFTRFFNPSAIYAINPVSKETMEIMVNQIQSKPISAWDVRDFTNKLLTLKDNSPESVNHNKEDKDDVLPW